VSHAPRPSRILATIALVALGVLTAAAAHAASASIEQVRNGQATETSTPTPSYGTGNAGASNSHYLESHSISYRAVLDGLPTDGTVIELIIGYDVKRSGSYALDYLTHYQRLLPHVLFKHRDPEVFNPLDGVSGVPATFTTAPIPIPTRSISVDPDGSLSDPAALQPTTSAAALSEAERMMTLFGGTLIDVSYVNEADVSLALKSSESQVKVRFTTTNPKVVLAWGGHIASRWDWGFNADQTPRSAGGISGSSYHMRLIGWNLGSIGSQDRSMSTDAVFPVPKCGVTNTGPFCAGSTNIHVAPTGMESYEWQLFDNTAGATIVGSSTGGSVTVQSATGGSYGIMVVTGASGFTKQCQATVTVNAATAADAGADVTVCAALPQVQLAGIVANGNPSWTGGAGIFSPGRNVANPTYTPTAAEITAGTVTLTLNSTVTGGPCPAATDAVKITIQKIATTNAGVDQIVCAISPQVTLAATFGGSATGGSWSGGAGTFTPSANVANAVYLPTAEEIAAGIANLTFTTDDPIGPCDAASDAMKITINPAATVNAGADLTVCKLTPQAQLAGVIGGAAATAAWSGGTGTYSPNASTVNAIYTPSAAEITAGGVTLTLTTNDPAGPCGAVNDQIRITISPAATANAGVDQVVCATAPQVLLAGVFGGAASGGTWSGGSGSFNPDASTANATYTPSLAEIAAGVVNLTFTTNDPAGPCDAASDAMKITINPAATVNAGADLTVCSSSPQAQLAGVLGGAATGGTWSGGGGSYSPNASTANALYTPTVAEIAAGIVTLTFTTNDPTGPCGPVSDQVKITINPAATVNAGADLVACSSSPQVQLGGSLGGGASSGTWTGGTGSFNPGTSSPTATYTPSASEIAAGGVTLTFTTNDPSGPCGAVSDQVHITISPAATVTAGADVRVCAGSPAAQLAGSIGGGASSATWSGGAGSFSPKNTTLNATYMPTAAEIAAGSVTLTLTTNDPTGPCGPLSDQVKVTIDPITVVDAGLNVTVCSSSPQVQLNGSVTGTVSGGYWTGGTGNFNPGRSSLNPTYTPSGAEIAAGTVTLTLTSVASSGPCPAASDQVTIAISPAVTVNAGPDLITCAATPQVQLAGVLGSGATSGTWSGGSGTFNPNANTLNAIYTPTAGEIAARSVTLTLTTNDPAGPCPAVNDAMKIIYDAPVVTVPTRAVCSGIMPMQLCANPSQGIAPYTYRWNNGATSQCIAVADTGTYAVTITDSKGCQATGSGGFRWRDCNGMLAHTSVTCATFMDGTGDNFGEAVGDPKVDVNNNVITNVAPGVFFYYSKIVAPRPDFTIVIDQVLSAPGFPMIPTHGGQINLYDQDCNSVGNGTETSPGISKIDVHDARIGQVFIISVKYNLKDGLIGTYMDENMGCHYDFRTLIDGNVVDWDRNGMQIGKAAPTPVAANPTAGNGGPLPRPDGDTQSSMAPANNGSDAADRISLYRPTPNPFIDGMRLAYAVGTSGENVEVTVFDIAGRPIRSLTRGAQTAGRHLVTWDGRDEQGIRVHAGMYFVHVRVGSQARQVRVTFLK
jgi:hypothetical protein